MSEYVFVDPERLRSLAYALRDAANTLNEDVPTIVNVFDGWNGQFSAGGMNTLKEWLQDQWQPMLDRADYAATMAQQPVFTTLGDPQAHWRTVPWEITDDVMAQEAVMDATYLNALLRSDDPDERARGLEMTAEAMEAHADDPAYLESFFTYGGGEVIDSANRQAISEDVPLSTATEQYLGWLATGVAATSRMSEDGEITLADGAMSALTSSENTLQTGIMMNYGPTGDQYGDVFLAGVADAALEWRENNAPPRPGYSEGDVVAGYAIPAGWVQDDGDWWTEIGIDVSYIDVGYDDAADGIALMREYDPTLAILERTGENPESSRILLTGDDGLENAQRLIDHDWQTPGVYEYDEATGSLLRGGDDSGPASSVVLAATEDRGEANGERSAEAAANVFHAGYDAHHADRTDYESELYPTLPPSLTHAMATVGTWYAPDMARSTGQPDVDVHGVQEFDGQYWVQTNTEIMNGYLQAFMTDPTAAGAFRGAIHGQLHGAAQLLSTDQTYPDLLTQYGYLNGMVSVVFVDQEFEEAAALDAENARHETYYSTVLSLTGVPGLSGPAAWLRYLAANGGTVAKEYMFPTGAAEQTSRDAQYEYRHDIADMRTYLAQGFVASGAYPLPDGASFVHDGVIDPRTEEEQAAFDAWWSQVPRNLAEIAGDASDGFGDATHEFAPNDDRFNEPR